MTSSFDWTVKLWNLKESGKPLFSFENYNDCVYDVQWSPVISVLFDTYDEIGKFDLWNLLSDSEIPTVLLLVDGSAALNKLRLNQNGNQIAAGDDKGRISLYDVNEAFAKRKK